MKRNTRYLIEHGIKGAAWLFAFFGAFTILGDGWVKVIGIVSILWMAGSTVATWIDERRSEKR